MTILPRRKQLRLSGFDYASEGAYFVMVVTQDRETLVKGMTIVEICSLLTIVLLRLEQLEKE